MKQVVCPKCKCEFGTFCLRVEAHCPKCGNIFAIENKPVVPNYNIIGGTGLTATQRGLIEAGKGFPGAHVQESEIHLLLLEMANRHANYQALHDKQGHQLFQQRVEELYRTLGKYEYAEIAAESWVRQINDTPLELGIEMFVSWKQSPGHWNVASKKHKFMGGDMAKSKSGVWYACILIAD